MCADVAMNSAALDADDRSQVDAGPTGTCRTERQMQSGGGQVEAGQRDRYSQERQVEAGQKDRCSQERQVEAGQRDRCSQEVDR